MVGVAFGGLHCKLSDDIILTTSLFDMPSCTTASDVKLAIVAAMRVNAYATALMGSSSRSVSIISFNSMCVSRVGTGAGIGAFGLGFGSYTNVPGGGTRVGLAGQTAYRNATGSNTKFTGKSATTSGTDTITIRI